MVVRRLLLLLCLVVAAFLAALHWLPHSPDALGVVLPAGLTGALVALGGWTLLTPAMVPGTLLALASGLAFGAVGGSAVAVLGGTLGGLAAFTLARHGVGPVSVGPDHTRRAALVARLERRGVAGVALLRIAPGVPATALHYLCGCTRLRARQFAAGIALGAAPRATAYAVVGAGLGADGRPDRLLLAGGSILLAALGVTGLVAVRLTSRPAT